MVLPIVVGARQSGQVEVAKSISIGEQRQCPPRLKARTQHQNIRKRASGASAFD